MEAGTGGTGEGGAGGAGEAAPATKVAISFKNFLLWIKDVTPNSASSASVSSPSIAPSIPSSTAFCPYLTYEAPSLSIAALTSSVVESELKCEPMAPHCRLSSQSLVVQKWRGGFLAFFS